MTAIHPYLMSKSVKIVLRQASSLANACEREAKTIIDEFNAESGIRFSAHMFADDLQTSDTVARRLRETSAHVMSRLDDALALFRAQSQIRTVIGRANAAVVSPLQAEREVYLKAVVKTLTGYLKQADQTQNDMYGRERDCPHDAAEIAARIAGIRRRLQTVTTASVTDTVTTSKLSASDIATIRDRLAESRRREVDLSLELSRANLGDTIELPDDVEAILRKHKIIA
jgi:hypothetical protein